MSSRQETLAMYALAFFLLITNLPSVEDILNEGACDWICTAETDIDEESRDTLANGRPVKFQVLYEEQVHGECTNQTDDKNSSATASLWLKMAAGDKPRKKLQGRLELFTQTILEGIFGGQFAFGTYKVINVSCIFESASTGKSGSNYSSRRLSFHSLQSVLYFVEHAANFTKPSATFLTFLRTERNIRFSFGTNSTSESPSSSKSAKNNELIVTDGWFAVSIIIWTVVFSLYFAAIFTFFQPSEIKLKVPRTTREVQEDRRTADEPIEHTDSEHRLRLPVQEIGDGNKPFTCETHLPPTGHDVMIPSQSDSNSAGSQGSEIAEGARCSSLSSKIQLGGAAFSGSSVLETKKPSNKDSEITLQRRYRTKASSRKAGRVTMLKERFEQKLVNGKNPTKLEGLPPDLGATNDSHTKYGRRSSIASTSTYNVSLRSETPPTGSSTTNEKVFTADGEFDSAVTNKGVIELSSNRNISDLNISNNRKNDSEQASTSQSDRKIQVEEPSTPNSLNGAETESTPQSNGNIEEPSAPNNLNDAESESSSQSNRNIIEEPSAPNSLNDAESESSSQSNRNIEEQSGRNNLNETRVDIDQFSGEEDQEETDDVLVIIVGKTYPVGFGSCIGNKLFSTTHERNTAWNIVKLIFMFSALQLLFFLGLGDLILVLLPNLHSRLSDHFPFAFLTPSLGYSIINSHPILLGLMVLSAPAYLVRCFCFCFLSSSTLEAAWRPCSVHRKRPTCFARKLLQCCISSLKPCEDCCNPAPSECSKYLDLPENIVHNLEKQLDIFIKYWDSFCEFWSDVWETNNFARIVIGIFSPVIIILHIFFIIIFIIIDIFFTSPLFCLSHGRLWMLAQHYKNKFMGSWSRFIFPILEFLLMFFSLVWVTIFSLRCAIPLGVATIGLFKVLGSHTSQVLPQVTIGVVVLLHFWSCYKSFRARYRYLVKFLASRYQKKYDELENSSGVNALIHYKQGDLEVIPKELFADGRKEFKLSIKKDVALLFVKLVCTLLALCFVFPILGSDNVSDSSTTSAIISFLAVAYGPAISNAINGEEFQISKHEVDKVVDGYIARKQRDSS